jgi:hypothetical protein
MGGAENEEWFFRVGRHLFCSQRRRSGERDTQTGGTRNSTPGIDQQRATATWLTTVCDRWMVAGISAQPRSLDDTNASAHAHQPGRSGKHRRGTEIRVRGGSGLDELAWSPRQHSEWAILANWRSGIHFRRWHQLLVPAIPALDGLSTANGDFLNSPLRSAKPAKSLQFAEGTGRKGVSDGVRTRTAPHGMRHGLLGCRRRS